MITHCARLLTGEQVERIHEGALQILEEVGLLVRSGKARARFASHGCRTDSETRVVRFPRAVVEHYRQALPPSFIFHGRDEDLDRTIPDDGPLFATASSAPNIIDSVTGQERRSRSDDIARIAHLVNELDGYDILGLPVIADDAPPGQFTLSRFYAALKNCRKPVQCSAPGLDEAQAIVRLGVLIAGGEEAYRRRPFMTCIGCPVVSPLTMDIDSTEAFMFFAEERLPCYAVPAPNAGMTAPLSLVGTLVLCQAEFLASALLAQMSRPGTLVVYGVVPTVADMRTGAYAPGGIETGMLMMGCAQMAEFLRVPCAGFAGVTNAKMVDAQAGFEIGTSAIAATLGGVDLLSMGSLLDALMAFDFGAAVVGDEIAQMAKRLARGMDFGEENLGLDVIAEVGPGGTFIDTRHTLERTRTTAFLPRIADRQPRSQWQAQGGLHTQARAMQRVRDILTSDNPAIFAPEVDARIRAEFEGLVAGDAAMDWTGS